MEDKKVNSKKLTLIILMIVSLVLLVIGVFVILAQTPNFNARDLSRTSWLMFVTLLLGYLAGALYTLGLSLMPKSKAKKESGQVGGSIEKTTTPK
jgi:uncharacterized Tic20 family protein